MTTNRVVEYIAAVAWKDKLNAFVQLMKFRLSSLVAVSAMFGYAMAAETGFSWWLMACMGIGGLMITGASNAFNQLFEVETDKLMQRTANRPLPTGRLQQTETLVFATLMGAVGILLIGYLFNLPAALLGIIGLLSYAFVYTPMKRQTPFAVFVGAIPGALPPLIGWVAVTGQLDPEGLLLFFFQFFWQFPHFWAIAWLLDEDYQRGGFRLLPSQTGKSRFSATLILIYTLCLIPLAVFPLQAGLVGLEGMLGLMLAAAAFSWPAVQLFRKLNDKYAKQLMLASFLYLPVIQLIYIFG